MIIQTLLQDGMGDAHVFCGECGSKISENESFCGECGALVDKSDNPQSATHEEVAPQAASVPVQNSLQKAVYERTSGKTKSTPAQSVEPAPKQSPDPDKTRRKSSVGIIVAIIAVVAIVAGGIAWFLYDQDLKRQYAEHKAWEEAHTKVTTIFTLNTPEFDDGATAIPVHVEGTDLDGIKVSDTHYISSSGQGIELLRGNYDFIFSGGYFTGDGDVAETSDRTIHVVVDENTDTSTPLKPSESEPVEYSIVPALDVTNDLLDSIEDAAKKNPDDKGKAAQLRDAASKKHDQAVEEKEKAERAAALHVETRLYAYDLPDELYGKIRIEYKNDADCTVNVFCTDLTNTAGSPILTTARTMYDGDKNRSIDPKYNQYLMLGNGGLSYSIVYNERLAASIPATLYPDKNEWLRLHESCVESAKATLQVFRPPNAY